MKFKKNKGFTVIELLVVIGLIAVLVGALIFLINPVAQLQRSRDARRKADLRQIQSALELYRSDQLTYPTPASVLNCGSSLQGTVNGNLITYITKIPCDPKTGASYIYVPASPTSPASSYTIMACLENANDPDKTSPNSCPSSYYSYTLQSP